MSELALHPAITRLIDALAAIDVQDYLREQAALRQASNTERPDHVALQPVSEAA